MSGRNLVSVVPEGLASGRNLVSVVPEGLAYYCEDRAIFAANQALRSRPGTAGSTEWIREAADYAAVAASLRARDAASTPEAL